MDLCENNDAYVKAILTESHEQPLEQSCNSIANSIDSLNTEGNLTVNESLEKHSAVWTTRATSTLIKLYESKLGMLETPKKKRRIWEAVSENLKVYNIDMTPDQIRWKINALTKKYKQAVDSGDHDKFRYFKEMENIYTQHNVDCDSYTITELLQKKKDNQNELQTPTLNEINNQQPSTETRAMIELRKIRLANRIESERSQSKIQLEKQWLQYLHTQEEQKHWRDGIYERTLKLREEELELRKRNLELKEALEFKKIQLMEREQEDLLKVETEKCDLLKQILNTSFQP